MSEPFAALKDIARRYHSISELGHNNNFETCKFAVCMAARAELEAARELLAATVEVLSADSAGRKNEIADVDSRRLKAAIAACQPGGQK